ncbi:hypothetical protein OH77DRAFT_523851 [Trametes cingulata]|nr:hypothetical protein OH77DRAFT_523851 [Trametes cingulata]
MYRITVFVRPYGWTWHCLPAAACRSRSIARLGSCAGTQPSLLVFPCNRGHNSSRIESLDNNGTSHDYCTGPCRYRAFLSQMRASPATLPPRARESRCGRRVSYSELREGLVTVVSLRVLSVAAPASQ